MWKRVRIIAETGTEFGIISDTDGELIVCAKPSKKKKWPHGIEPKAGRNVIEGSANSYIVTVNEEEKETDESV